MDIQPAGRKTVAVAAAPLDQELVDVDLMACERGLDTDGVTRIFVVY